MQIKIIRKKFGQYWNLLQFLKKRKGSSSFSGIDFYKNILSFSQVKINKVNTQNFLFR